MTNQSQLTDDSLTVTIDADLLLGMCEIISSLCADQLGRHATGNASYNEETLGAFKEVLTLASAWAAGIKRAKAGKNNDDEFITDASESQNLATAESDIIAKQAQLIEALKAARDIEYRQNTKLEVYWGIETEDNTALWQWDVYRQSFDKLIRLSGGIGFSSESAARAAGQAYIDNLTAPEIES